VKSRTSSPELTLGGRLGKKVKVKAEKKIKKEKYSLGMVSISIP
jgi:hypothetical protein